MKVVQIIARLNVGGSASQVVWLAKKLETDEFASTLIAGTVPPGEEDMSYFAVEQGVEPIYIAELSRELSPLDAVALFKIYRELCRQRPDIVHTHTAKAGAIGRIAALMYRWLTWRTLIGRPRPVKVVHTFHGHVFHSYYGKAKTLFFIWIERFLARFATDRIVVITKQQFDEIHTRFGIGSAEQFEITPYGIDLDEYADDPRKRKILRDAIGAADDDFVIAFFGRLTEIKNVPLLLDTARLHNESGEDTRLKFVIVGDGNLRDELQVQAETLGLGNIVKFLGNRNDVPDLIAGSDAVAITSKNEGTPLSLIEAMAARRPVISTAVGGVVDLLGSVEDSREGFDVCERGLLVEPNSPEPFLCGLILLARDEKLRERLAASGKRFVDAQYSLERLERDVTAAYKELFRSE